MAGLIELNVSDGHNVTPNLVADQATQISGALELLGNGTYSNTAYFPGGIYYLGDTILTRTDGGAYPINVTLRGDGPGVMILKLFFVERANLFDFDNGTWNVDAGILHVESSNASGSKDSDTWTISDVPANSKLYIRRKLLAAGLKTGMKFQVFPVGSSIVEVELRSSTAWLSSSLPTL